MAGQPAVQVEGSRELRRALKKMEARLDDLKDAHRDAADVVIEEAHGIVPVRSGALASSIRGQVRKTGAGVIAGKGSVPYAAVIHFGWPRRNIEPQPFLYQALDRRKDEVARTYEQHVGDLVRKLDHEA